MGTNPNTKFFNIRGFIVFTWGFFMFNLQINKLSKVLINSRGISICSSKIYGLGFAPKKTNDLFKHLKNSGFKTIDIIRSGLVYSKKIKSYRPDCFELIGYQSHPKIKAPLSN